MNLKLLAPFALAGAALVSACGSDNQISDYQNGTPTKDTGSSEQNSGDSTADGARDHTITPPQEYYDALFALALKRIDQPSGLALLDSTAPRGLWLNFGGASLHKGFEPGESFLLCDNLVDIPGADLSPADQEAIVAKVQKFFDDAGASLNVSAEKLSGDYTTIHVGGSFADLGCRGSGVLGVAPFDVGNANKSDVGFAFTKGIDSVATIAETIAHEAGHTFGLDHTTDAKDLMYASSTSDITGFLVAKLKGGKAQDGPAILKNVLGLLDGSSAGSPSKGGSTPPASIPGITNLPARLANLPGLGQIAMIAQLLATINTADIADISKLVPQIIAILPTNAQSVDLAGLDKILTVVGIAATAASHQNGQALPTTLAGILNSGLLSGILDPKNAAAISGLAGLATLAGFGNVGGAVTAITSILAAITGQMQQPAAGGTASSTVNTNAPAAKLPDFGAILGLGASNKDLATVINNLLGTAEIIAKNYGGAEAVALLSLVKVAYSQLYAELAKQSLKTP